MKQIKRWHPQFKLEQCAALKSAPLPKRPGAESAPTSATKLLEMMKDRFPAQATEKLEARKKELEIIELKKIEKEKSDTTAPAPEKSKIPAHILAKIRAKQAAKVCAFFENKKFEFFFRELRSNNALKFRFDCDTSSQQKKY